MGRYNDQDGRIVIPSNNRERKGIVSSGVFFYQLSNAEKDTEKDV